MNQELKRKIDALRLVNAIWLVMPYMDIERRVLHPPKRPTWKPGDLLPLTSVRYMFDTKCVC